VHRPVAKHSDEDVPADLRREELEEWAGMAVCCFVANAEPSRATSWQCGQCVTTCTQGGSDCKAVRRGVVDSEGTKVAQGPDRAFTVSNRVFYKELEEGACKIVDVNMILLA